MSFVSLANVKKFTIYVREFGLAQAMRMTADKLRSRYDASRAYYSWIKKSERYDPGACLKDIAGNRAFFGWIHVTSRQVYRTLPVARGGE